MTDRELLELAAKACGLEEAKMRIEFNQWNPLEDDGDALRLAVQLKLEVFFHPSSVEAHIAGGRIPPIRHIARELYDADPYAATRRAIVRAAAEIGRNMK
jgi:hypothetical protein